MINGFELSADTGEIGDSYRFYPVYKPMMDRIGVTLLVSTTNIMQFFDSRILRGSFGAVLASSALVLGRLFSSFFIASSYPFNRFFPDGSHLLLDHLMSSETLKIIHDAPTMERIDKTMVLSNLPDAQSALRVCNNPAVIENTPETVKNCCQCEKCIRTMATLKIAGKLGEFIVFPKPLQRRDIRKPLYTYSGSRIFALEIARAALKAGDLALAFDFFLSLLISFFLNALFQPLRMVHLTVEQRSEDYRKFVVKHHPMFKKGYRRILRPR
jgi:hypothetical protein